MNICAFLVNRNNVENGYLERCLTSMSLVADELCVYDDFSDQDVWPIYKRFNCTVVKGHKQAFHRELYHKDDLLQVAARYRPDWVVWIDSDAVLGRLWEDRKTTESILDEAAKTGYWRLFLHNINLWKSNWYRRLDLNFDELWHAVWWKNTGQLHYRPKPGLHQRQYPFAFYDDKANAQVEATQTQFAEDTACLMHFGFSTDEEIAAKYFQYRANGQSGGRLNRLVSEGEMVNPYTGKTETRTLERVPESWFPKWLLPELGEPGPEPEPYFSPEMMAQFATYQEWNESRNRNGSD